jgi:dCMP deaminase
MNQNEYFMGIAQAVAKKSKDPNTKVGAVIVDRQNKIVSTGYNGFLPGYPDTNENWSVPKKYDLVIHAELNAILYAKRSLDNCAIYCTLQPCLHCMKAILASGMQEIYYGEDRLDIPAYELAFNYKAKLIRVGVVEDSLDSRLLKGTASGAY